MQYRPTDAELLEAIADLLVDEVQGAVPEHLRHRVRVAENLVRILEREARLGPPALQREAAALTGLVGPADDVEAQRVELGRRLRASDDPAFDAAAWEALVAITRDDLAIAKPGHDGWEGP